MFQFDRLQLNYEPFPYGIIHELIHAPIYRELGKEWPMSTEFFPVPRLGKRHSLSEERHPRAFQRFLKRSENWRQLYSAIQEPSFCRKLLEVLYKHSVDLGLVGRPVCNHDWNLSDLARRSLGRSPSLRVRVELSEMPSKGGYMFPHTDIERKVLSLIIPIETSTHWAREWGGGTCIYRAKNQKHSFNLTNRYLSFDEVETLHSFDFVPNQAVLLVKTFNSLHGVAPLTAPPGHIRRALNIYIEKKW